MNYPVLRELETERPKVESRPNVISTAATIYAPATATSKNDAQPGTDIFELARTIVYRANSRRRPRRASSII